MTSEPNSTIADKQSVALAEVETHRQSIDNAFTGWLRAVEAAACLGVFAEDAADSASNAASDCMEVVDQVSAELRGLLQIRN